MSDQDPEVVIADNLELPKKGTNDMGSFEQHSLPDQIAAAQYLGSSEVGKTGKKKWLGMLTRQMIPPGTVR